MYKKIIGILVMTLLITTALPAIGTTMTDDEISINNSGNSLPLQLWGKDQQQTKSDGYGFYIIPTQWCAQGFKPTKEKLTAVQLYILKINDPPAGIEITVSIRDSLNGSDLTIKSESADQIEDWKWVWFDFPDINVTPEKQYYIICRSDGGVIPDGYGWLFANNNTYNRGDAWTSFDEGLNWTKLESGTNYQDPDFCFKTYSKKPRQVNRPLLNLLQLFLQRHPNLFTILQYLLGFQ
jgi:hypothetical protein